MMLNRVTIIIITAFLLCVPSFAQDKVVSNYRYLVDRIDGFYIPMDIDEAVNCLDTLLSKEDKQYIADSLTFESFCTSTHFSVGMWIRNNWGLWGGSRLQKYFTERNIYHPDDMSGIILEAYYKKKIKGMEYSMEDNIPLTTQPSSTGKVIKSKLGIFLYKIRYKWSREMREEKRELKNAGIKKGKMVSFKYPYGCSTKEEQDIWLHAENPDLIPKGKILDINYNYRLIKVELISTISPHGIIVFDGNLMANINHKIEKDFNNFTVDDPNRFYMQKGEVLWFDVDSYWEPCNEGK